MEANKDESTRESRALAIIADTLVDHLTANRDQAAKLELISSQLLEINLDLTSQSSYRMADIIIKASGVGVLILYLLFG